MNGTHLDPGARSIWVDIYQMGTEVRFRRYTPEGVKVNVVKITPEFVGEMFASFDALTAAGDRVTVLKEHEPNGEHYGTVHELRVHQGWVQARMSLVPSMWAAYDDQRVVEVSPAFAPELMDPHTGAVHRNVLLEVTLTSMALQHTLRPPQQTNASLLALVASGALTIGAAMAPEEEEETPAEETEAPEEEAPAGDEEEDKFASLTARVAALEAALAEERAEKEAERAAKEAAQAASRQMEDEMVRRDLLTVGIAQAAHATLIPMHRSNRAGFDVLVEQLRKDSQTPIGTVGSAPVGEKFDASSILAEAAKAGVTYGNGLAQWVSKHHPTMLAEVIGLARN